MLKDKLCVVVRGAPACGKTTVSNIVKTTLEERGYSVGLVCADEVNWMITWDGIHSLSRKLDNIRRMLANAELCFDVGCEVVILEGVFSREEELAAIRTFATRFTELLIIRLTCSLAEELMRNRTRDVKDRLDETRIEQVLAAGFASGGVDEKTIDSTGYPSADTAHKVSEFILGRESRGKLEGNPTLDSDWRCGLALRYKELRAWGEMAFVVSSDNPNRWRWGGAFDFPSCGETTLGILALLRSAEGIEFRYLNRRQGGFEYIADLALKHSLSIEVLDEWNAPLLGLKPFSSYASFLELCTGQSGRNARYFLKNRERASYIVPRGKVQVAAAWARVVDLDRASWKAENGSDMSSLDSEHLQYIPGLLGDSGRYSLMLCELDGHLVAYSLMICSRRSGFWVHAKWGASDRGREHRAGIMCLLEHIRILSLDHRELEIDFWGRRNQFYDGIATGFVERVHVLLKNR